MSDPMPRREGLWLLPLVLLWGCCCTAAMLRAAPAKGGQPGAAGPGDPFPGLTNAAQHRYGARFDAEHPAGVVQNAATPVDLCFDGSPHTRCAFTGAPYTIAIELCDRLPIDRVALSQSDIASEAAPKEIEIDTDDGPPVAMTLRPDRPAKGEPAWQEVKIDRPTRRLRITVKSNYEGQHNWGGLGEVAVLTPEKLDARFQLPGYDRDTPTFVHSVSPAARIRDVKVSLPPRAGAGEHPCLLMTPQELAELRKTLQSTGKGREALKTLLGVADGACRGDLKFPDPKGPPGQLKDRGDAVAREHGRLSSDAGTLGIAYALTGEARYARRAAEILRGYAERYDAYPEHKGANKNDTGKVMGQRLSEAMWLIPQVIAYDYVYDSGALSDAEKKTVEEKLLRPCVAFVRRKLPADEAAERDRRSPGWRTATPAVHRDKPIGNWLNFYNAATLLTGAVTGDRDSVDLAVADFRELIQNGIGDDGMWGEGAIGYQLFAVRAMAPGLEAAARQGIDLWGFADGRVKLLFDSPLWYAYPDATAPGINDSTRERFGDWSTMVYDYAWLRFHDDRYAAIVNRSPRQLQFSESVYVPTWVYADLPEPRAVAYPSMVFQNLGYAVLRGGDRYTLLKYGPHGGTHGHYDKLNLILFAGDELGGEPRFHRYEDPLHAEWTVQTVAHNTMTVDESRQEASAGRLLVFEDSPAAGVVRAEAADAYPGVLLDRTVVVTPAAVLDVYQGRSALPHTWDRTLRFNGKPAGFPEKAPDSAAPLGRRDGYQHLHVLDRKPAGDGWNGSWAFATPELPAGELRVSAAPAPPQAKQEAIAAFGPDADPVTLLRQQGTAAAFGTAYAMKSWSPDAPAARFLEGGDPNVLAFSADRPGHKATVFVANAPGPWSAAGVRSDARVLYVEVGPAETQVVLAGGTTAKGDGFDLHFPAPGNYTAAGAPGSLKTVSEWAGK